MGLGLASGQNLMASASVATAKAAGPRVSVTWARSGLEFALPRKMVATARAAAPRINVTLSKQRASRCGALDGKRIGGHG